MLKNKTRLFLIIFAIIAVISTFSFAADEEDTTENALTDGTSDVANNEDETTDEATNSTTDNTNSDVYEGDLYIGQDKVTMDKLVNGNVYICGGEVTITGQIAGNLYVMAKTVTFEDAYIESSAYIMAENIYFKAVASDLYACCKTIEIPSDYGVYRDLKTCSKSLKLLGIVGRDAYCNFENITLEDGDAKANVYGNFNYYSTNEIQISDGIVQGEAKYTKMVTPEVNTANKVLDKILEIARAIVFTLVIYGILFWLSRKTIENSESILAKKWLKSLGFGILALILIPIISVILMFTVVGIPVAFIALAIYALLLCISTAIVSIAAGNLISKKLKIEKQILKILVIALIAAIIAGIGMIPYVGIIEFLIVVLGFGIMIVNILPKKQEKEAK